MIKAQCQRSKRCAQCLCTSVAADINGSIVAQYINEWGGDHIRYLWPGAHSEGDAEKPQNGWFLFKETHLNIFIADLWSIRQKVTVVH